MATSPLPSPDILRQLLRYEPETGKLFWRARDRAWFATDRSCNSWNSKFSGKEAISHKDGDKYLCGSVLGAQVRAHRVVMAMHLGRWPSEVDHVNGNKTDNRLLNLREVCHGDNSRNFPRSKVNKSGRTGVSWDAKRGKWYAYIRHDYAVKNLGRYDDIEDAIKARREAERKHGFHENHGR